MRSKLIISLIALGISMNSFAQQGVKFDRGIYRSSETFIPKGSVGSGISFSWQNANLGNAIDDAGYKMMFSMLDGIKGEIHTAAIAPWISYFVFDNLSVGGRFNYTKTETNLAGASISLGDDMSFGVEDFNYIKKSYSGALAIRYYMPVADSRRFGLFTEGRLQGGYAQAKNFKHDGEDKFGTYQDIYSASLNMVPGICVFVSNNVAFEVSISVLGFEWQKIRQTTNQVEVSEMTRNGLTGRINPISVGMGLSFFIPTK